MRRSILIAIAFALLLAAASAHAGELGSRPLREGSRGPDVVQLQRSLRILGYGLTADGVYGPKTVRSVRRYERRSHLKVDGIVGARQARRILRQAASASSGGVPAEPGGPPPPPVDPPAGDQHVFPVAGTYSLGTAINRFGAPRSGHSHEGQDILAPEGTAVVSVTDGTVHRRAYQAGGAGNYVIVRGSDGFDYAYMHFRSAAVVAEGAEVAAGQKIGEVGSTGASSAPHLHFEIWTAHWRDGGHPVDPLPKLQAWTGGAR